MGVGCPSFFPISVSLYLWIYLVKCVYFMTKYFESNVSHFSSLLSIIATVSGLLQLSATDADLRPDTVLTY